MPTKYLNIVFFGLSFGTTLTAVAAHVTGTDGITLSVPKASCGRRDRVESGLRGQTTFAERFSPGSAKAYSCNLELVGQFAGEGSSFGMTVFENCAYYSTWPNPRMKHPGVVVLDVTDSRHPRVTSYLDSPAMLSASESLEVNGKDNVLLANRFPSAAGSPFDLYDLSGDCSHPILITSTLIPRMQSHSGQFAPDGRTFYAATIGDPADASAPESAVFSIDVTDPSHPRGLATWIPPSKEWLTHSVRVNKEGTRAYVALGPYNRPSSPNGVVILDISDIQARRWPPRFTVIGKLFFSDTQLGQFALPATINGAPYLIWTDVAGTISLDGPRAADSCTSGKPGHGFARIIDIKDETNPTTAASLMLEVANAANCSKVMHDPTVLGYGSVWCDVDNQTDARLLACGHYEGGLRVFDIRNPKAPREVAYYKPPAWRALDRPGSPFSHSGPEAWPGPQDHTADAVVAPKFRKNGEEIWFNSFDNGFQVVRFTDVFKASHRDLFPNN